MFSSEFLFALIVIGLIWTGAGAMVLIGLLIRDFIRGELW